MENYTFTGIIGDDASAIKTKNGYAINFDVAINKSYKNKETNEYVKVVKWIHCTKWATSEKLAKIIKKGMCVFIEGDPSSKHYTQQNGEILDTLNVIVQKIELYEKRNTNIDEETV